MREGGCWWKELVQVCRRWRCLIVESPFRLGVGLLYMGTTPVARMLAHEPPLPLGVNCSHPDRVSAKEKQDIKLALQHRGRVHTIWLEMPVQDMESLIMSLDGEFPMLEHLGVMPSMTDQTYTGFMLPLKFQAPHLRRLMLHITTFPIRPPSLTTNTCLIKLSLTWVHQTIYPRPDKLIQWLLSVPQLEMLQICFKSPFAVGGQISPAPTITHISFPKLRRFTFKGNSTYFEVLLPWIRTALLEKLCVVFFDRHPFPIEDLLQILSTFESLKLATRRLYSDWRSISETLD